MMKITLIVFGLTLTSFISHTYAQFVCNSMRGYDTKHLTSAVQWQTQTDYNCLTNAAVDCNFYFSFCQPAPNCLNEYSACQNASHAANVTILAEVAPHIFYPNGTNGFYAKFPAGPLQVISNTTNCTPTLIINFNCNRNAKWLLPIGNVTATAPEPNDVELDKCETVMFFDYAGACYSVKTPEKGISGGAVFLIILFSVALVYFGAGMLYNKFVNHQSGIQILPHAQFWIGFPLYTIEGCRTTLGCMSGTTKPSPATYESV